ncbi:exported hypothetical protein [Xanthomonas citri pv. citri]|nr:exported hypothetical protein [Xanthomonas citri pv. citri]
MRKAPKGFCVSNTRLVLPFLLLLCCGFALAPCTPATFGLSSAAQRDIAMFVVANWLNGSVYDSENALHNGPRRKNGNAPAVTS